MKIIFFGTDDFASVFLRALMDEAWNVVACVTQPDRCQGRKMTVIESPVKVCAREYQLPLFQPESVKDPAFLEEVRSFHADVFVVIAYGQFLPAALLGVPSKFAINVHGSLLPKYRGAAPINWAIINGETATGITIMRLNERMDAGDIIEQITIPIGIDDDASVLREKMKQQGPLLLTHVLSNIKDEQIQSVVQNNDDVSLAPKLTKESGKIDWNVPAADIHNLVRGLIPWPTAFTFYKQRMLKILSTAVVVDVGTVGRPGEIVETSKEGFCIACGENFLLVKKVHYEACRAMDARSFVCGHQLHVGDRLGKEK